MRRAMRRKLPSRRWTTYNMNTTGVHSMAPPPPQIAQKDLVRICATNPELYGKVFFPKAFRQNSPSFANDIWKPLDDPLIRLVNLICFRGSSKTTRLRIFTSKRIAYGISRTVLYIGASERDAIRSVQWLRTQVERNT